MIGSWNDDGAGFDSHDDVPAPKASEHRPWCKTKEVEYRLCNCFPFNDPDHCNPDKGGNDYSGNGNGGRF